jgi:hypothetical protein
MTQEFLIKIRNKAKNIKYLLWAIALIIVIADMAIIFAR